MKVDLDCHNFIMEEMERRETYEYDLTKVCEEVEESDCVDSDESDEDSVSSDDGEEE